MSTLRVSNIEAKADASSPTIDEQVKVTNSNGDVLLYVDGRTSGITTVGINTTAQSFEVDSYNNFNFTGVVTATKFSGPFGNLNVDGNVVIDGNLGVGGTITYEDVARVDAIGISTFREGFGVGPLTGIALTAYKDGSIRTSGIVTAASFYGDAANLTNLPASAPVGTGTDKVFWENGQNITATYTIANWTNAGTFGPITVAVGKTVTIGTGSYWTIV